MSLTSFQLRWVRLAERWNLRVETSFSVDLSSGVITVPVLVRDFGGTQGMLLVTEYEQIRAHADELVELGFGYSCLSEPRASQSTDAVVEDEATQEMLTDWGWSGSGEAPRWLCEPDS